MKILFITDNYPPEVNAPSTRTYEHCQTWIKEEGVEITVITCAPNFPHGKVFKGYKNKLYQKDIVDGVTVIRVWSYLSENAGFAKRILDFLSFSFMSFWVGLFQKTDIIIATSPQFFTTWSACALSILKRRPWIFELRDIWPQSIRTVGVMDDGYILNTLEKIELFLYRNSNKVVVVTDAFKENLINRGIPSSNISVVTNGSNLDFFSPREKDEELLDSLGLKNKFVVGYIGTHGLAHSLDFIVNAISEIKDMDIHFLFIGDGAMKENICTLAENLKLKNITFLDPIPREQVPLYLSCIDISLAPLRKDDTFKTVIPSKIFESCAMLKPILLGVEGQAKEIMDKYQAGLCFEPENKEDFLEKLYDIRDKVQYEKFQKGCAALAKDFDRKKLAKKMLEIIKEVSGH